MNEHELHSYISDTFMALLKLDSLAETAEEVETLNKLFDTTTRLARQMNWFYKKDKKEGN